MGKAFLGIFFFFSWKQFIFNNKGGQNYIAVFISMLFD